MSDLAIKVEGIGKQFRIGAKQERYKTFREAISEAAIKPFRSLRAVFSSGPSDSTVKQAFWALKDVSFEIKRGEIVGIIGRNGAGKSTLLKVLSRITDPTTGHAEIHGRIASLLEVGTGFHPELTGRENIFLNGAILGMRRFEISRKFDEIVAFAEVENFVDTPVKYYSSGMYLRLAFAVAAHLEPEILMVDEVLAVGDVSFQKKCLGKMGEVSREEGRTVLFVSHNMQAVSTLTERCLLLKNGNLVLEADPGKAIAAYLEDGLDRDEVYVAPERKSSPFLSRVEVQTSEPANTQTCGKSVNFIFDLEITSPLKSASFSFQIVDSLNQPVVHLWIFDTDQSSYCAPGSYRLTCQIPRLRLYMGSYSITTHLASGEGRAYFETLEGICPFEVVMFGRDRGWRWQEGACRYLEDGEWTVKRLEK